MLEVVPVSPAEVRAVAGTGYDEETAAPTVQADTALTSAALRSRYASGIGPDDVNIGVAVREPGEASSDVRKPRGWGPGPSSPISVGSRPSPSRQAGPRGARRPGGA